VLGLSSLSFDLSVYDIFGLLGCGGRIVLPEPARLRDPAHWLALMKGAGVTVWNTVPRSSRCSWTTGPRERCVGRVTQGALRGTVARERCAGRVPRERCAGRVPRERCVDGAKDSMRCAS
jgi:hypothetical protein